MLSRKTPLYNNTALLSPTGLLLARIERKKVKWYLERQLGEAVTDADGNIVSLRLFKEPKGAPGSACVRNCLLGARSA